VSTRALKEYLDAREALRQGKTDLAAGLLEVAIRSPRNNQVLRGSLEKVLNHKTLAGGAVLELIRVEVQRRG
jgi:hypothetical protein